MSSAAAEHAYVPAGPAAAAPAAAAAAAQAHAFAAAHTKTPYYPTAPAQAAPAAVDATNAAHAYAADHAYDNPASTPALPNAPLEEPEDYDAYFEKYYPMKSEDPYAD